MRALSSLDDSANKEKLCKLLDSVPSDNKLEEMQLRNTPNTTPLGTPPGTPVAKKKTKGKADVDVVALIICTIKYFSYDFDDRGIDFNIKCCNICLLRRCKSFQKQYVVCVSPVQPKSAKLE